jgi:hypothetical protein
LTLARHSGCRCDRIAGHGFIRNWSSHLVCVGPLPKSASKHLQPIYNGAIAFARRCLGGPIQSGTRPLARRGATPRLGHSFASTGPSRLDLFANLCKRSQAVANTLKSLRIRSHARRPQSLGRQATRSRERSECPPDRRERVSRPTEGLWRRKASTGRNDLTERQLSIPYVRQSFPSLTDGQPLGTRVQ